MTTAHLAESTARGRLLLFVDHTLNLFVIGNECFPSILVILRRDGGIRGMFSTVRAVASSAKAAPGPPYHAAGKARS